MRIFSMIFIVLFFSLGSCAHGPAALARMDENSIKEASDWRVCDAQGVFAGQNRRSAVVDAEVARRLLDCSAFASASVSDCSNLSIIDYRESGEPRGMIFTVTNSGTVAKYFRIYHQGIQSSRFYIEPTQTQQVGVAVNSGMQMLGRLTSGGGNADSMLNECLSPVPNPSYQVPRNSTASAPTVPPVAGASPRAGVTSVVRTNVNRRAGPGTDHAIVGTLQSGTEVTVLSVNGAWCECMLAGQERFFVSCRYLVPPSNGWAGIATANSGDDLRFAGNTRYVQVRQRLLAAGYQPMRLTGRYVTGCQPNQACLGFSETVFCTGTGENSCWYSWRRGNEYIPAVAGGEDETNGQIFSELRRCSRLRYSEEGHPWTWCTPS